MIQNCFKTCDNTRKYCTSRWTHFSSIGSILVSITTILTSIFIIPVSIEQVNTPLEVTLQLTYILCATFIHNTCCSTFTTMYIHMIFFHWAFVSYYKTSYQAVLFKRKIMYIILAIQSIFVIYSASTTSILYNISSFNNQNVQTRTNKIIIQRYSNFQLKKQRLFIWGHMYAIHKIVSIFYVFI